MNNQQKQVVFNSLVDEQNVLRMIEQSYQQAAWDCSDKIAELSMRTDLENMSSIVYQKKYQETILSQIQGTLDALHQGNFATVQDYLDNCYKNGFIGAMYDMQGQGVPMLMPIDPKQMVQAITLDSKLSVSMYSKLGENIDELKSAVKAEVSRGLLAGKSWNETAFDLRQWMTSPFKTANNNAQRIARTEGHRVQMEAQMDACEEAKSKGADVVKQWDATLDGRTRDSHAQVDGEIRELDEKFSNGLRFPSDPHGAAEEVINCRCALLQRARWALDDDELEVLRQKAEFFGFVDENGEPTSKSFVEFKNKYLSIPQEQLKEKKKYVTEKSLKNDIADLENQLNDLDNQIANETDPVKLAELQKQKDDLEQQKNDLQTKLQEKVNKKEIKALGKEQVALQDEIDTLTDEIANADIKTYSGIWKDDVTTADFAAKQNAIQAKRDYFENKLANATDPNEIAKWQKYLDDLDEFEKEGQAYYDLQQKLQKAQKTFADNAAKIDFLKNGGVLQANNPTDAFTEERRNNALWAKSTKEADAVLRQSCGDAWIASTQDERHAIYEYTQSYHKYNEPLRGYIYGNNQFVGVGNVDLDLIGVNTGYYGYAKGQVHKLIDDMTTIIGRSEIPEDMWMQRGVGWSGMDKFFNCDLDLLRYGSEQEIQNALLGTNITEYGFMSCGVAKGKGFSGNIILNIYAPKGTHGMYAEPFSAFGNGASSEHWDGRSTQSSFGHESEIILQRNTVFTVAKVEKSNKGFFIDLWVTDQPI